MYKLPLVVGLLLCNYSLLAYDVRNTTKDNQLASVFIEKSEKQKVVLHKKDTHPIPQSSFHETSKILRDKDKLQVEQLRRAEKKVFHGEE
ncbi:hypothetical protein IM40_06930 [Candidatus Paracaedimonas acanthamoebae]|nr:hypothetical protein IM40_06930 [Candidatus Paracaedimonas acanthamoebae]